MKKILLIALLALGVLACKTKDETLFSGPCNCGNVLSDDSRDYSVVIKSNCSGNEKKWILSRADWMNAHVGSDYCITNSSGWRTTDTLTREEAVNTKYSK